LSEPKGSVRHEQIDDVLSFILIRKLVTPVSRTKAYKLGLVDGLGRVIKEPETTVEKKALTTHDRLIFKLRRMLGSRISELNNFLYIQTIGSDYYSNLVLKGGIEQRTAIKRLKRDIPLKLNSTEHDLDDVDYLLDDMDYILGLLEEGKLDLKENNNEE
tara:strand:+ start:174 stop:650 length:477 start_codon:yes stop_codon:yes gene_type:complete